MNRLTFLQINIIGIVAALLVALILWLGLVKPKQDAIAATDASIKSVEGSGGTDEQVQQKKSELAQKTKAAEQADADWKINSARYMPPLPYRTGDKPDNLINIYEFRPVGKGAYGFKDLPSVWGRWITAWYDAQQKAGVTRMPGVDFAIPAFDPDPNAISHVDHLTFPDSGKPWQVLVNCKSFNAAMQHLGRFNDMERHGMPVIDDVALAGQSPNLQLSYTLALYIIPSATPPAADPRLGSSGATAGRMGGVAGMGGAMGGRGGMPGFPGGGMPGFPGGGSVPGAASRGGRGAAPGGDK